MGIFDKAKDALGDNPEALDGAVDKASEFADEKTGGQYSEQIDQGADFARDKADEFLNKDGEGE